MASQPEADAGVSSPMYGEQHSLLGSQDGEKKKGAVPLSELTQARNAFFVWTFFDYIAWGIVFELYTNLFYYVIDKGDYAKASLMSTIAMSMYSVASFFISPVAATLSDTVGRKPLFILATLIDTIVPIVSGLIPANWIYITMMILQGAGDNSMATGYSLLADYATDAPKGHSGSVDDNWFCRGLYWCVRLGKDATKLELEDGSYMEYELNIQFTVVLVIQTVGMACGVLVGDSLYSGTGSYEFSYACAGFFCAPMVLYVVCFMPETVPPERRKPLTMAAVKQAFVSQIDSFKMFSDNRRLWGLAFVNFLIQIVSAGIFDVVLYWGEWKFGWDTGQVAEALYVCISAGVVGAVGGPRLLTLTSGFQYSFLIAGMTLVSVAASIPAGLCTTTAGVMACLFFFGIGFGNAPAISAQIGAEAKPEDQGRVQGFNYAIMTAAWCVGPFVYWAMFEKYVDDDAYEYDDYTDDDDADDGDDDGSTTHPHNIPSSLMWWVTAAILSVSAAVMLFVVKDSTATKLTHNAPSAASASGAAYAYSSSS